VQRDRKVMSLRLAGLHREFQAHLHYRVRPCLKRKEREGKGKKEGKGREGHTQFLSFLKRNQEMEGLLLPQDGEFSSHPISEMIIFNQGPQNETLPRVLNKGLSNK
jgi:hypothetical protein